MPIKVFLRRTNKAASRIGRFYSVKTNPLESSIGVPRLSVERPIGPKEPGLLAKPNRTYFIG